MAAVSHLPPDLPSLIFLPIYRLYLSPLARFPGRTLAIVTPWYEFYYEWVKGGAYIWEIQDMHRKYGPIVRISPRELHVDDPDFYDELFTQRLDKDPWVSLSFGSVDTTQATASAELHRSRRAALAPFFTAAKVTQLQSVVTDKIETLSRLLLDHQREGTPADMHHCYRALTTDVITEYAFSTSWNFLHKPDMGKSWFKNVEGASGAAPLLRHIPWITPIMDRMPEWLALTLIPDLKFQYEAEHALERHIKMIMEAGPNVPEAEKKHPTIFYELLYNGKLQESEKHIWRMIAEGALVVIAGNESTGNTLNVLHFHLLANPEKMTRLKTELAGDIKGQWDVPTVQQLKKLPYLTACIEETLRLSSAVPHRLARLAPQGGLHWRDHIIPEGTSVSMSNYHMHMSPDVFPRPNDFWPERWLQPEAKTLKKYLAPFSKGPRMCLGIELAYAELYLTTAMIHRRFQTELCETVRDDIVMARDLFVGYQKVGSKGLQVKVKE